MSKSYRALLILAIIVAGAAFATTIIACAHYEPPVRAIWLVL
ncbi:hypothetical protein [Rhizobium favelukesii]|nr:hypothetical protein [Rhizobium favelukesii]